MIDELVKTIRLHLSERLTSPLMGAFICSWVLWNYRAVLIIASEEPVRRKFFLLSSIAFPDTGTKLVHGLLLPLATALLYIFAYPLPARFVYKWTGKQRRKLLDIRRDNDAETLLTKEDSDKLKTDLLRKDQEIYTQTEMRDREIERLNAQVARLREEIESLRKRIRSTRSSSGLELTSGVAMTLDAIQKLGVDAYANFISRAVGTDVLETEVLLNDIASAGLVSGTSIVLNGQQTTRFALTAAGKKELVKARREGLL